MLDDIFTIILVVVVSGIKGWWLQKKIALILHPLYIPWSNTLQPN